ANWTASNHTNGGTPGSQNSTYDISPDVQGPNILNLEVINPTSIQLTFDEPMDELSLINAEYTMEPEIGINSVTTTNWQTTLHLIDPLVSGNEYTITVNGVTDCSGNEMISNSISIYYDIEAPVLENIEVANEHEILVKFNEALEVSSATFLPNYEVIHFGNPVSINLQEEDSSVMLSFDQVFISGQEYQLQITGVQDLTENVLDTTELTFIYHPPFSTASVVVESTNSLNLTFNQHLDRSSAETLSNYSLSAGYGNPISAELIPDHSDQVLLVFSDDFVNNQYTLTINEVENENQDETISDQTIYFEHEVATPFRALVINEIYADYNPSAVGLPDEEFVELYNNSNQNINIADFQLNGEAIQDFELASGAYVILTDNSNLGEYESFGEVVSIISFPTLTNGGMQLLLTDNLGNLVDSISYSDEWYLDENKEDGGFSLEQINPELTCNHSANWTASNDAKGGTPGSQNSTYDISPDVKGPNILNLEVINPTSIQLTFDEPMNESSLINAGYTIDPEIGINSVTTTNWQVTFVLADPLVSSKEYTITVNGVTDCTGNNLVDN
ncbi:MAG: Ig-like domain-containing protein, partial [Reichenbachiella sp.]